MDIIEFKKDVLISTQKALWGMIDFSIRAIAIGFNDMKTLKIIYYLDREPIEEDYENISEVTSEILADIDFLNVEEKCIFTLESINKLDNLDSWVYIRKNYE